MRPSACIALAAAERRHPRNGRDAFSITPFTILREVLDERTIRPAPREVRSLRVVMTAPIFSARAFGPDAGYTETQPRSPPVASRPSLTRPSLILALAADWPHSRQRVSKNTARADRIHVRCCRSARPICGQRRENGYASSCSAANGSAVAIHEPIENEFSDYAEHRGITPRRFRRPRSARAQRRPILGPIDATGVGGTVSAFGSSIAGVAGQRFVSGGPCQVAAPIPRWATQPLRIRLHKRRSPGPMGISSCGPCRRVRPCRPRRVCNRSVNEHFPSRYAFPGARTRKPCHDRAEMNRYISPRPLFGVRGTSRLSCCHYDSAVIVSSRTTARPPVRALVPSLRRPGPS